MKKCFLLLILSLFGASSVQADSTDKRLLSEKDLQKPYAELWMLKNDIFARHGYRFNSPDLQRYYERRLDYQPVADNRQVVLNNIEQQNVELIQARLNVLGAQRKQLVEQLHSLKSRGQTYVRESVKIAFEEAQFEAFQQLLAKLDYDALHKSGWSKKVVDNGELELTYQAEVQGDKLTISFQQNLSDKSVLRLSEDVEWTIIWHFQLLDGKLRWRKTDIAG